MRPLVIGHRGAPGYLPEHSAASYLQAIALGADAVETDLVMSGDGVLIVRHEPELSRTTDVALRPEFAARRRTCSINGRTVTGWFTHDFTLAELRCLNAPTPGFSILTFDELLLLLADAPRSPGRPGVGLHVEVKVPSYYSQLGLSMTRPLLDALYDHGRDEPGTRTYIQSFDAGFLDHIGRRTALPLVQLMERPRDLVAVAEYADAIGPSRELVLDPESTGLVAHAHRLGLDVFVWTLTNNVAEARGFFAEGVDGIFSDFPDLAVRARQMARIAVI
ncbi:MAG: glycerophosphodiester phosphodiesterase family protein [Nocardioides sp.]